MQLQLKPQYRKVHECSAKSVALQHAHLDFKTTESLLALMLMQRQHRGPNIAFICAEPEKFQWTIESWFPKVRKKTIKKVVRYELNKYGVTFWLTDNANNTPVDIQSVVVTDAHQLTQSPVVGVHNASVIVAGAIADRGHWFNHFCNNAHNKVLKFNYKEVIAAYPEQESKVLDKEAPEYRRHMLLEDTSISTPSFGSFAKRRLKVRTDKGKEYLSPKQQLEAEKQLGPSWHTGRVGSPVVSFELSKLQKKYRAKKRWWAQRGINKVILLKYRRGGFTTVEQGESYALAATAQRAQVATLAHTEASTKRIFRIAKLYHEFDPKAPKLVQENQSAIELANGSYFFIGTAGGRGGFRGDTVQRVHGSEVAFWCEGPKKNEKVEEVMAAILGAASRGQIVLESTPNGIEWFANTYKEAKKGLNDWGHIFLRWFDDPSNILPEGSFSQEEILDTLSDKEKLLIEKENLSINQIAFRRKVYKDYKRLAPQEWPEDDESCFLTGGTCFFDVQELLEWIDYHADSEVVKGKTKHYPGGQETRWEEPEKGVRYVMGVDSSEGLAGCDPNGIGIMRKDTGAQVCSLHGRFNPTVLAEHVLRLWKEYNHALVGIERESYGHVVIQKVKEGGIRKPHFVGGSLYHFKASKNPRGARAGWDTNSITRPKMLTELDDYLSVALNYGDSIIRDHMMISECLTFRLQSSGKFEADSGAHDDSVMKWAIANQMRLIRSKKPKLYVPE